MGSAESCTGLAAFSSLWTFVDYPIHPNRGSKKTVKNAKAFVAQPASIFMPWWDSFSISLTKAVKSSKTHLFGKFVAKNLTWLRPRTGVMYQFHLPSLRERTCLLHICRKNRIIWRWRLKTEKLSSGFLGAEEKNEALLDQRTSWMVLQCQKPGQSHSPRWSRTFMFWL